MKAHLAKVSLALLSVAFLLGCQEQGSDPVGPEGLGPEFHHGKGSHADGGGDGGGGDNPGSLFYEYTFTGDITTAPSPADARSTVGNDEGGEIRLHQRAGNDFTDGVDDEALILSGAFLNLFEGSADNCFDRTLLTLVDDDFITGTLRPDKKDMNKVEAVFHFHARDKEGLNEVTYRLALDGTADTGGDEIFPPEHRETTTVTFTDASIGAQRKKEKNACSGAAPINISVKVTGRESPLLIPLN